MSLGSVNNNIPLQSALPKTKTEAAKESAPVQEAQKPTEQSPPAKPETGKKEAFVRKEADVKSEVNQVEQILTKVLEKPVNPEKVSEFSSNLKDGLNELQEQEKDKDKEAHSDLDGAKKKEGKIGNANQPDGENLAGSKLMIGKKSNKEEAKNDDPLTGGARERDDMAKLNQTDKEMDGQNLSDLHQAELAEEEVILKQEMIKKQMENQRLNQNINPDNQAKIAEKSLKKPELTNQAETKSLEKEVVREQKAEKKDDFESSRLDELQEDSAYSSMLKSSEQEGMKKSRDDFKTKNNKTENFDEPAIKRVEKGTEENDEVEDLQEHFQNENEDEAQEDSAYASMLKSSAQEGLKKAKEEPLKEKKDLKEAVADLKNMLNSENNADLSGDQEQKIENSLNNLLRSKKFESLSNSLKDPVLTFLSGITSASSFSHGSAEKELSIGEIANKSFVSIIQEFTEKKSSLNEISPKFKIPVPFPEVEAVKQTSSGRENIFNQQLFSLAIREIIASIPTNNELKPKLIDNLGLASATMINRTGKL